MDAFQFENLGQYSFLKVKQHGHSFFAIYSHVVDFKKNGDSNRVYGWKVSQNKLTIPEEGSLSDELLFEVENYRNSPEYLYCGEPCTFKVTKHSQLRAKVFVEFEFELLPKVIRRNVEIFQDYEDQGFYQIPLEEIIEDFSDDGEGKAQVQDGEFIVIDAQEYSKLF